MTSTRGDRAPGHFKAHYTELKPVCTWKRSNRSERAFSSPQPRGLLPYFLDPCYYLQIDTRAGRVQDSTQQQDSHRKKVLVRAGSRGHEFVQKGV